MKQDYKRLEIDLSRDELFDEMGLRRLKDSYMTPEETSPQQRFDNVALAVSSNLEHAQRLYDYASKHWLSFSTPILSYGRSKRGLPISCFLSYMQDSAEGLVDTLSEVNWLSMLGGGVGIGMGIRSEDDKSVGIMPHLKVYEASSLAYRQGKTRRGSYAAYLDIDHPNIVQFIEMRKPTGDANMRCQELHHGINISDEFMELIEACMEDDSLDDTWGLKDPGSDIVKNTVSAKWLWEQILETRMRTGEPYLHFIDTSNRYLPDFQKDKGLAVNQSNICTEIILPTDKERTAVCCLSSLNLVYWEMYKNNYQFFKDVAEMLDNVLDIFINKAPYHVRRAVYSASQERAIGVGALGFHEMLQAKSIPFESALAVSINRRIFKTIQKHLENANHELAAERGECPDGKGYGVRFSRLTSIAPNASSSFIMGNTSPSIEPFRANAYRQDTLSGSFLKKNKHLDALIKEKIKENPALDYDEIWSSIISSGGSVQHLDFLNDYEKDIYKTFSELDQLWVIQHAADRQPFIDQAQSLNLSFKADASIPYIHHVHFMAWKLGLPTLYYCRSDKLSYGDKLSEKIERVRIEESFKQTTEEQCIACEG
jgi:ribonucleoside-diphosphate reductase alpha chain